MPTSQAASEPTPVIVMRKTVSFPRDTNVEELRESLPNNYVVQENGW